MAQSQINLVHIMRPPKKTLFGSSLRIGFVRAWAFTAVKVLVIASFINGANLFSIVEKNVILLDQYARNDFYTISQNDLLTFKPKNEISKIIITQNFEPRGPQIPNGEVASAHTENTP